VGPTKQRRPPRLPVEEGYLPLIAVFTSFSESNIDPIFVSASHHATKGENLQPMGMPIRFGEANNQRHGLAVLSADAQML
jgi:hypothetical protein